MTRERLATDADFREAWHEARDWFSTRYLPAEVERLVGSQPRRGEHLVALTRLRATITNTTTGLASVDDEDLGILQALSLKPNLRLTADQIDAFSKPRVCRRTVLKRLPDLLRTALIYLPKGPKGGYQITPLGLTILNSCQ
jgi:hypothetical protein